MASLFAFTSCRKPSTSSLGPGGFNYLDAKLKLNYQTPEENLNAKVRLRMKKDSLIWVSISGAVGVEGMRALVREDSIFLIDRVNKKYLENTLDTLSQILNFKVDFQILQSLILGEMPFPNYDESQVSTEEKFLRIQQQEQSLNISNLVNPKTKKLEELVLKDVLTQNAMEVIYGNYKRQRGVLIPQLTEVNVQYTNEVSKEKIQTFISLENTRIELTNEKLSFPFSIPDRYRAP